MTLQLYLKAYATGSHPSPGVCLVKFDADVTQRLQTLANMVRSFAMESIGDHFQATWREPAWEAQFTLAAPQLVATATHCWWAVESITAQGSASLYTERVHIDRLMQACNACTTDVLHYTEDPVSANA